MTKGVTIYSKFIECCLELFGSKLVGKNYCQTHLQQKCSSFWEHRHLCNLTRGTELCCM